MKLLRWFWSRKAAINRMLEIIDDPCINNLRWAYASNKKQMKMYMEKREQGCCGFYDGVCRVWGRKFYVGCNYGH